MIDFKKITSEQLAVDFNTDRELLKSGGMVFTRKTNNPEKRAYENGDALLNLLCYNGLAVFSCGSDALLDELKTAFSSRSPEWVLEMNSIHLIDEALSHYGETGASTHIYYIPAQLPEPVCDRTDFATVLYRENELERFRGDERFDEALGFNPDWRDMAAITAEKDGEILGMAAASADAQKMWQIGINVLPGSTGAGIGVYLVKKLRDYVLSLGIMPFYSTAQSHIISQKIAHGAGFVPAWAELYSKKIGESK